MPVAQARFVVSSFLSTVKLLEQWWSLDICRTSAGHVVVIDPEKSAGERAGIVRALAREGALDALFFPCVQAAMDAIDQHMTRAALAVNPGATFQTGREP